MGQRHENDLLDQRMTQRVNRGLNQFGAVVERNDMNARRQAGFNLPNLLLHAVDYVLRVLARPRHDHATDGFGAVFYECSGSKGVAHLDGAEVFYEARRAIVRVDDDIADIFEGCDQTKAAHDGPGTVLRNHVASDVRIAGHDGANDGTERERIAAQTIRVDVDLVLLDGSADAGHFRDTRHGIQLIANVPILQGTKIPQAESTAFNGVPKDVADTGCIRSERWNDAWRKLFGDEVQTLENTCSRKIEVHVVFEDDEDHGEPKRG